MSTIVRDRKRSHGGAKVPHFKNTMQSASVIMPVPDKVVLAMQQHIGAPCEPAVQVGDLVKVGTVVGEPTGFVSAPIHASVSGKVSAISEMMMPAGNRVKTVTILSDGLQEKDERIKPPSIENRQDFLEAVRASGLVGLGGAGFPTHVKLGPKNLDAIDTLIINGAECEPFITSDYREMVENTGDVIAGIKEISGYLGIKRVVIAIEENKPEAIGLFQKECAGEADYQVKVLPARYPQGAEKVLIYEVTGRIVGEGMLPADVGVIVLNIGSTAFLHRYLQTGMPLVQKRLTVDGGAIEKPQNVVVPIGTSIADIVEFCGGYRCEPKKILMGGPMMGLALCDDNYPVLKNNNAVLALDEKQASLPKTTACIRCGRCVEACPMNLMPESLAKASGAHDVEMLGKLKVMLCMECGTCSYVCPAKRPIVASIKLGKAEVRAAAAKAAAK